MTAFRTCHTCAKPAATCGALDTLKASIAGLGLTSVKHRCAGYAPAFTPGDAIKVETLAWFHNDEDPPPKLWFPGHFIRMAGQRAIVFVPKGAEDLNCEEVKFEPHGNGYLKVPLARVAHRDAPAADVTACRGCAAILGVGDPCGRDPNYTPSRDCALIQLAAATQVDGTAPAPTGQRTTQS